MIRKGHSLKEQVDSSEIDRPRQANLMALNTPSG